MGTRLPHAVPYAQQLAVVDYRRVAQTSAPVGAGAGTCEAVLDAVPAGETWLIDRMLVLCSSSTETDARVYAGRILDINLVDGTISGNLDVSDENQPILLNAGEELRCVWTGASDDAVGTLCVQYRIVSHASTYTGG